jgi:hypothetical protein
MSELMSPVTI